MNEFMYKFPGIQHIKTNVLAIVLLLLVPSSCDFRRSPGKDLQTSLKINSDGLSCENVYISIGKEKISRDSFIYGEKFYLNFENIEGLTKINGYTYPDMQLIVISQAGDTILKNNDLYSDYAFTDGVNKSAFLLQTYLTAAKPLHSNKRYALYVNIRDKKGSSTYQAKMGFKVVPNNQILIKANNVSFEEIYLFSQERNLTITDNHAKYNENINLIFEGLDGFNVEAGEVFVGISIDIKDSRDNVILKEEDLIGNSSIKLTEFRSRIAPSFKFEGKGIINPVTCDIIIWDKKSAARIRATFKLIIE